MRATLTMAVAMLVCGVASPARAQPAPRAEVSAGYVFMQDAPSRVRFPAGWTVGTAVRLTPWLSAVAEADGSSRTAPTVLGDVTLSVRGLLAGGRLSARVGPFVEFAELLVGAVHASASAFGVTSSTTALSGQAGVGLDVPITRRLSGRGQFEVRLIRPSAPGGEVGRQFRFVAALAYAVVR